MEVKIRHTGVHLICFMFVHDDIPPLLSEQLNLLGASADDWGVVCVETVASTSLRPNIAHGLALEQKFEICPRKQIRRPLKLVQVDELALQNVFQLVRTIVGDSIHFVDVGKRLDDP